MLPFFFCVSGGGGVQIRARTRAPSWEGGTSFVTHARQPENSPGRATTGICGSLTSDLPREDAEGSSSGTSWYRAGLLRALAPRPPPPPSRPQRFNHRIRTTTALWCVRNPGTIFSRRPAEFRPRGEVLAGSLRPPSGGDRQWRRIASFRVGSPCSDPRRPRWPNCRWLDSSGYIGNLCSRETGLNFYISNEMGRVSASPFRPPRDSA